VTSYKPIKYKQFNEVSQVKACKVRQTYNTLTNPQALALPRREGEIKYTPNKNIGFNGVIQDLS
tara:strand:- start:909 stop:1100 length:192 start_codon:yes stop_codon:yes gene_type:complete